MYSKEAENRSCVTKANKERERKRTSSPLSLSLCAMLQIDK